MTAALIPLPFQGASFDEGRQPQEEKEKTMGLDMYAYKTFERPQAEIAFDIDDIDSVEIIHAWRKHPNLHGWMEALYRKKGGKAKMFNCEPVVLTADDLDALEAVIKADDLPNTEGFFFGVSDGTERERDLAFIEKARAAIAEGYTVYYESWW